MSENKMLAQVISIPALINDTAESIKDSVHEILSVEDIFSIKEIVVFGSGDSYNAAVGSIGAFMELGKVHTYAKTALEASRYYSKINCSEPKKNILAIGISNSGEASRTVEALMRCNSEGYKTLALTSNPNSRLAEVANKVLIVKTPSFPSAPGVRTYITTQLALFFLAIRIGEVKEIYSMAKAKLLRNEVMSLKLSIQNALTLYKNELNAFSKLCSKYQQLEILGSGPCRASADFAMAKVIEAYGYNAVSQDIEEFAHVNLFRINPEKIPTILIAPYQSSAIDRALEVALILKTLKRPHLVLTDGDNLFAKQGNPTICLNSCTREVFSPIVFSSLSAYIVAFIQGRKDDQYYRGHKGAWSETQYPNVRESKIKK